MTTTLLMFIAAILLSAIAGYYSVIGMTAIFSGAFIPILLMTGTLEASKVIVASWLYNNWRTTPILLKSYLTAAVVVLMFITSMGIFGFLSKAHIQQTAAGAQAGAQIERLGQEIDTQNKIIEMATKRVEGLMSGGQGGDASINLRIEQANKVIDSANARIQPRIDDQQRIIDLENSKIEARVSDIQSQIADIDKQVSALDEIIKGLVDQQRSVLAQRKRTEQAKERDALAKKKSDLLRLIDETRNAPNPAVDAAKAEIEKIRSGVESEVKQARDVINGLTSELGKNVDTAKMQSDIDEQNNRIRSASTRLDELTAEKFKLETQNRQLEVEVGPIKYIAQLVYGDVVDMNMLERSVRYMILILIFVFDPLAILMLIASNQGLAEWKSGLMSRMRPKVEMTSEPFIQKPDIRDHQPAQTVSLIDVPTKVEAEHVNERVRKIEEDPMIDVIDGSNLRNDALTVDETVTGAILDGASDDAVSNEHSNTTDNLTTNAKVHSGDDPSHIGLVNDTEELLNKLQRLHEVRLQKFATNTSNNNVG